MIICREMEPRIHIVGRFRDVPTIFVWLFQKRKIYHAVKSV